VREVAIFDFTIESCGPREGVYIYVDIDGSCVTGTQTYREQWQADTCVTLSIGIEMKLIGLIEPNS
jgi:hypothetical protein